MEVYSWESEYKIWNTKGNENEKLTKSFEPVKEEYILESSKDFEDKIWEI